MLTSTALASLSQLLRDSQFVHAWMIGICRGISQWLEMLVAGIFAYEVTGSPFMVAALFIARLVPLIFLGSLIGTFADRTSPRLILLIGFCFAALVLATNIVALPMLLDRNVGAPAAIATSLRVRSCATTTRWPARLNMPSSVRVGRLSAGER